MDSVSEILGLRCVSSLNFLTTTKYVRSTEDDKLPCTDYVLLHTWAAPRSTLAEASLEFLGPGRDHDADRSGVGHEWEITRRIDLYGAHEVV